MNIKKIALSLASLVLFAPMAKADKGMWLLNELKKENIQRMKELGFNLDPTKLFNMDAPSIANAVVIFGGGCTGITVSDQGLIFTNHHCGYGAIQSQSTVEHDYLQDGFVSHKQSDELPIPGLKVQYLHSIVDVTKEIMAAGAKATNEIDRIKAQQQAMDELVKKQPKNPHQASDVYAFYENNKFYLITYDVFTDVRLAFAPPSSVGKFGHDSDNWMWPRHTNDFSVFRVYAGKDNKPADYSKENKPYKPRHFAKISLNGVKEKDFSMTIGFPGSTDRYLSSWGVEDRIENNNKPIILVRGIKQKIWNDFMSKDQATRIQYASKFARSSNYWKNSIGMNKGLKRLNVVENKRQIESEFAKWVATKPERKEMYGFVLDSLRTATEKMGPLHHDLIILSEALSGSELRAFAKLPDEDISKFDAEKVYKDFNPAVAKATLPAMLKVTKENVAPENLPSIFKTIETDYAGDYHKYAEDLYANSVVVSKDRLMTTLKDYKSLKSAFETDPAVILVNSYHEALRKISEQARSAKGQLLKGRRLFFKGLQEMWPEKALPSDANFTMRLSYGSIGGYKPYDAGYYNYFTTQQGVFEKQNPEVYEYRVQPEILKLLADKENYGPYGDKDGNLHINFISNNDITGGNSGSPVFNANGNLIGLAFDGNWEAMSGDIEFEPNLQRCIGVDIRYVLFFIDKWGKASNLMKELSFSDK